MRSLLDFDQKGQRLPGRVPRGIGPTRPALEPGVRLGHYEIETALGAGGMGEVYRARDTRLGRVVALKVLPHDLTLDPERRDRFEREAHAISRLNHPKICALYDVGREGEIDFLVMELLEGETLAERLKRKALTVPEALEIGVELAEALEAAHRGGVVHRDLKPGNVMLTRSGAKLLDFSLAKLLPPVGLAMGPSGEGVTTEPTTRPGSLLGTLHYMSPEQLEGKPVDARSDVFVFGCLLHEMLTGQRAFEGESPASVVAAILRAPAPRLDRLLDRDHPAGLQRVLDRCLAKQPDDRWQAIGDVAALLRDLLEEPAPDPASTASPSRSDPPRWAVGAAAILGLCAVAWLAGRGTAPAPGPPAPRVGRFVLEAPDPDRFEALSNPTISPDGRSVAFIGQDPGAYSLWVRELDRMEPRRLEGPESPGFATFSPDGQWLAYFEVSTRQILKVSVHGGRPTVLADSGYVPFSWAPDGCLYYPPRTLFETSDPKAAGLARVCPPDGAPEQLTRSDDLDALGQRLLHTSPQLLPDEHLLFSVGRGYRGEGWDAAVVDLASGSWERVLTEANQAIYSRDHLVFWRDGRLWAVPFDLARNRTAGTPKPVLDGVAAHPAAPLEVGQFRVGDDGSLVYISQGSFEEATSTVVRFDAEGRSEVSRLQGPLEFLSLSPEALRLGALRCQRSSEGRSHCTFWTYSFDDATWSPASSSPHLFQATWDSTGESVLVSISEDTGFDLARLHLASDRPLESLYSSADRWAAPVGTARDGRLVFTLRRIFGSGDIWTLSPDGRAEPLLEDRFDTVANDVTTDGRWLVYESDRSGRYEIYALDLEAEGAQPRQLSTDGGRLATVSPSQRTLYWRSAEYPDASSILTAQVDLEAGRIGQTREIGRSPRLSYVGWHPSGELTADDEGVWAVELGLPRTSGRIVYVQDWGSELTR